MTASILYSIRMRASAGTRHVSGAERLVGREQIDAVVREMVGRSLSRVESPDQIVVTVDMLRDISALELRSLDLLAPSLSGVGACRKAAREQLMAAGVSADAVRTAFPLLDSGPAAGGENMRGAMIMDGLTGERLEPDHDRGVRVSRFDWSDAALADIDRELNRIGLNHHRTREALALATKVAHAPGIVAELCWSDEPDYTAGYVASPAFGYRRFRHMKEAGISRGGRAFFVRAEGFDLERFMRYLQQVPVRITSLGSCRAEEQ